MNPLIFFRRPEYFFRPVQALHRLRRWLRPPAEIETVRLPWGAQIQVHTRETIGAGIYSYGIFDLPVCEAIARLLDPGETAADVGANIGQMSTLMRHRAGATGRVISFEPNPEIFPELSANLRDTSTHLAPIRLEQTALSSAPGEATLDPGPTWQSNRGMSRLVANADATPQSWRVKLTTLDTIFPAPEPIHLMKMDVEGHEASVLAGSTQLLAQRRIRDIIFEDFAPYPSPVATTLLAAGYTLHRLHAAWGRPHLLPPATPAHGSASDFLATLDPARATQRFAPRGWRAL